MLNKWFHRPADEIAVSSRVRLARNVEGIPFPGRMSAEAQKELLSRAAEALGALPALKFTRTDGTAAPGRLTALAESHLISPEFAASKANRAVFLSEDESVSVMVNEEDHLRLQVLGAGNCLAECLATAEKLDDALCERLRFSFDERLGYLTHCPTNLGTGLRASVMLHLPALTESGGIRALENNAAKMGIAIRGFFGEGSEATGALYQVSNQVSLGMTEEEIVRRVSDIVEQIIREEKRLRRESLDADRGALIDRTQRAVGTLRYAHRVSSAEAMELLSDLRLGRSLGLTEELSCERIAELYRAIMPSVLDEAGSMTPAERDEARAKLLREAF